MSNIFRRLSRGSSSKTLGSNDSSASSSASFTASSLTQNIVNSQEINIAQIESSARGSKSVSCKREKY